MWRALLAAWTALGFWGFLLGLLIIFIIWSVIQSLGELWIKKIREFEEKKSGWNRKVEEDKKAIRELTFESTEAIKRLAKEKSTGFPWLAQAIADYFAFQDQRRADYLAFKPHPARRAALHVREISKDRIRAERLSRILQYQLNYYESLFPWLTEFRDEDIDDMILKITAGDSAALGDEETDDPTKHWLTDGEYSAMSSAERNQLALERYKASRKSKWQIGRDYERYVGWRHEALGYRVEYHGIVHGLHDLGRDLIARKDDEMRIIQCKCWSEQKQIHEKHLFQLFGTVTACRIDDPASNASGWFVTSTSLSERAAKFADALGLTVVQKYPLIDYPCVKCNVSKRNQEKIYHLPFDQQYDRTVIEEDRSEQYVETATEAEALGFRRAFRWKGMEEDDEG